MTPRSENNRSLIQAYLRIRELLENEGINVDTDEPWHGPGVGGEETPPLPSTTDLLIAWKPESMLESGLAPAGLAPSVGLGRPPAFERYVEPRPTFVEPVQPSTALDDLWDEEAAEAAVDCLFSFIHAIERRDIDAAMDFIATDYHVMEGDREIDRAGLRLQLEALLDRRRNGILRVSLAEVPEPVFHPAGILMLARVQVDHTPTEGLPQCVMFSHVVVLNETNSGRWLISALSPML